MEAKNVQDSYPERKEKEKRGRKRTEEMEEEKVPTRKTRIQGKWGENKLRKVGENVPGIDMAEKGGKPDEET